MLQIWRNPKLPTLTVLGLVVLVAVQASFSQAGRQQVLHVDSRIGDEGYTITPFSWKNVSLLLCFQPVCSQQAAN